MNDITLMKGLYRISHLIHESLSCFFGHAIFVISVHIFLKVTLFAILKHQVIIIFGAFDFDESHNILMLDLLENLDLLLYEFHHWLSLIIGLPSNFG
jgi:hypothetical protein